MKKIVTWVVILAVLILGGYYGSGLVAQRTFNRNMALLNDVSGLSVEVKDYQRGLFSSHANLVWQIQTPEQLTKDASGVSTLTPSKTITFDMPLDIYHGPVMITPRGLYFGLGYGSSEINLPSEYVVQFNQRFEEGSSLPKIELALFISFLDVSHINVNIPSFRLVMKQNGGQFEWLGLNSEHRFSSSLRSIAGSITLNGWRMSKQTELATLDKMTSSYDLHRSQNGLYLGDLALAIPSFALSDQDKPVFKVTGLELSNSSDVEDGLFASSIHAAFADLLFDDKRYGPGRVGFSIKNLDASVLAQINDKVNQAQQLSDTARQQALLGLLPMLPPLFAKGASVEVTNLSLTMPEGVIQGEFTLQLPKDGGTNPFQLLQKVAGNGAMRLPISALNALYSQSIKAKLAVAHALVDEERAMQQRIVDNNKLPDEANNAAASSMPPVSIQPPALDLDQQAAAEAKQKITALTQAGALAVEGNDYVIQVTIASGQLLVNGHPFDAAMLQF